MIATKWYKLGKFIKMGKYFAKIINIRKIRNILVNFGKIHKNSKILEKLGIISEKFINIRKY